EDAPATDVNVLGNDTAAPDSGETLTITSVSTPPHGTTSFDGLKVVYTPAANYNGADSFTYTISDGNGGTDTATVSVTVTSVNDPPDAVDDAVTVLESSGVTATSPLSNDSTAPDSDETLTIAS